MQLSPTERFAADLRRILQERRRAVTASMFTEKHPSRSYLNGYLNGRLDAIDAILRDLDNLEARLPQAVQS